MDNEITSAIANIQTALDGMDEQTVNSLDDACRLGIGEWLALGDKPSLMLMDGVVSAEGASTLHAIHTRFERSSIAERFVFLKAISEWISR